jgi:superoxide dismutase, Fe-Mn family
MKFQLPVLHWKKNELEPFLSAEAVEAHYYGHHKAYIDKTNDLIEKLGLENVTLEKIILNYDGALYDNAAQAWNHSFFWLCYTPHPAPVSEPGDLMKAIGAQYGSLEGMKERFIECASNLFGSGWTWLIANDRGEIDFVNTQNADNPIRYEATRPLWTCDIWEHAYYIDYRNQRKEYLEAAWEHVNWRFVEDCFSLKRIPNMSKLMTVDENSNSSSLSYLL